MLSKRIVVAITLVASLLAHSVVVACPYCVVESQTLAEEIAVSDAAVIAYLVKAPLPPKEGPDELDEFGAVDPDTGKAVFRIAKILKGKEILVGVEQFEAIYFGAAEYEKPFFLRGVGTDVVDWNIPMALTPLGVKYIDDLETLPESGPERLAYFLNYLQHEDPLLSQDAYDEFARSPYEDVVALKPQINKEQLWKWIESREVSSSRRSLYFTMLGVCGDDTDAQRLEDMMLGDVRVLRSAAEATSALGMGLGGAITLPVVPEMVAMEQRRQQLGFNALVGCYLKLRGGEGLDVVDQYFLANDDADYSRVYATCIALRFLGEEADEIPIERIRQSMRLVLDKPDFVTQAIVDLSRWEDWSVLDRLVTMYENAPKRTYIKEPIITYMDQAKKQPGEVGERAEVALAKFEELDPETVKRARSLQNFGIFGRAIAKPSKSKSRNEDSVTAVAQTDAESVGENVTEDVSTSDEPVSAEDVVADDNAAAEEDDLPVADEDVPPVPVAADAPSDPEAPAEADTVQAVTTSTTDADTVPAVDSRLVVLAPIIAFVMLVAVVWGILRGGV